jgi:hypothetical protein
MPTTYRCKLCPTGVMRCTGSEEKMISHQIAKHGKVDYDQVTTSAKDAVPPQPVKRDTTVSPHHAGRGDARPVALACLLDLSDPEPEPAATDCADPTDSIRMKCRVCERQYSGSLAMTAHMMRMHVTRI